jgi:hypothetical protein
VTLDWRSKCRRRAGSLLAGRLQLGAAAGAALIALAMTPAGAGAAPIVQHLPFSATNPDDNLCGIEGSSVISGRDNVQQFANGRLKDEGRSKYVFTATATRKSVEINAAFQHTFGAPISVSPDGSETFVESYKGLPAQVKLPRGRMLLRDAGDVKLLTTIDADGNLVSVTPLAENGPHPIADSDGGLLCNVVIAALT